MTVRSRGARGFREALTRRSQDRTVTQLRVEPPKLTGSGWLLRLRFENQGPRSRFAARITLPPNRDSGAERRLALSWRGSPPTPDVDLRPGEQQLLRLASARTAVRDGQLVFHAGDAASEPHYAMSASSPLAATVEVFDVSSSEVVALERVTISFRDNDLVPHLELGPPEPLPDAEDSFDDLGAHEPAEPTDDVVDAGQASVLPGMETALPPVDTRYLEEVLRCANCGGQFVFRDTSLACRSCDETFPIEGNVPILLRDSTTGTRLENIDYDAVHGVTDDLIRKVGTQWMEVINGSGLPHREVLEIGAGTGALTLGLLRSTGVERLTATDVSYKFLSLLGARAADGCVPLSCIACDAGDRYFRQGSFDLVVGRSILHHLLDYEATLANACHALRSGGAAIFFEPTLEGKTIVALLIALVLRADEVSGAEALSTEDRQRLRRQLRHLLKSKLAPDQDLSQIEDKYIFGREDLRAAGIRAGFSDVEFQNSEVPVPSYWPYLIQTLRTAGIDPSKVASYRWIGTQFANTYGLMFAESLMTPMGFFIFRK